MRFQFAGITKTGAVGGAREPIAGRAGLRRHRRSGVIFRRCRP
jgi:hypothetical protein